MKSISTSSPFTMIMTDMKKGKFVRTKKKTGLHGYIRFIPINKTLKLLDNSNIKHASLIRNRLRYVDFEFIDGKDLKEGFDKNILINIFCNAMFEMRRIDCTPIRKYTKWTNNSEFLIYMIDNLITIIDRFNNHHIMEKIGLGREVLENFKTSELDNSRTISFIHGDLHSGNVISRNNEYYIIDWEMACEGDVAYELAMHFSLMDYTDDEKSIIIDRISRSFGIDQNNLIKDIITYTNFEILRKCYLNFNRVINLCKNGKPYEDLLFEAYKYYSARENPLSYEELRNIIKEYAVK